MHVVLVGDSIAEGLGVAGRAYADVLGEILRRDGADVRVTNLARSARQIGETAGLLPETVALRPDVVVIAHGVTEGIVRPRTAALRLVPPRWRRIGWLDPRPYYSRRPGKRAYQKAESAIRWRVKNLLIGVYGGATLTSAPDFERTLADTVETLLRQTGARIVLLTPGGIDGRFYPGSPASLRGSGESIERVALNARQNGRVTVCRLAGLLDEWGDFLDDHFHPNAVGHARIAQRAGRDTGCPEDSKRPQPYERLRP